LHKKVSPARPMGDPMSANTEDHIDEEPIEDCSDQEGGATPLAATETPSHVFGRFGSLVGNRHSTDTAPASNEIAQDIVQLAELAPGLLEELAPGLIEELAQPSSIGRENEPSLNEAMLDGIVNPSFVETEKEDEGIQYDAAIMSLETIHNGGEDASFNEDGTITGGPMLGQFFGDGDEGQNNEREFPVSVPNVEAASDEKVDERFVESDSEPDMPVADDIPEETWMSRPVAERELWERLRPRHVRKEAARVKALRFPLAPISRLEKLHPDLQTKTSESLEVINYATVLLLQAIARATVGRKSAGHFVRFEDLRQVCANTRELQFLLPLSGTLDNSALVQGNDRVDVHDAHHGAASRAYMEPDVGQSTLNRAAFSRLASAVPVPSAREVTETPTDGAVASEEVVDECSAANFTPEKVTGKRKLQPQDKQKSSKASRRGSVGRSKTDAGAVTPSNGLSNFFKRIDAVAD